MSEAILWGAIGINVVSAAVWWRAWFYAKRARRSSEAMEVLCDNARLNYLDYSRQLQAALDRRNAS